MRTALVTGGCGFVGRRLTRRLIETGADVWLIDNLSTGLHPDRWLGNVARRKPLGPQTILYDLGESSVTFIHQDALGTMLQQLGIVAGAGSLPFPVFNQVFALASVVGGRKKIDGDPMEVAIDLGIDAAFFLWAVRNRERIGSVLYASSSAAYPVRLQASGAQAALREDMIDFAGGDLGQPDMTYGWSKLTGEYLSRIAARHYGLRVACVRPFSGYGEDQDLTYPVPAIALRAARRDDPLTVWGTGDQGRDFVYIDDCISAMLLAADRIEDGSAVNIGSGRLTTFREAAALFARLAGYAPRIQPMPGQPVGVQSRYSDPSRMRHLLDWAPRVPLEEGFSRVLEEASRRAHAGELIPA